MTKTHFPGADFLELCVYMCVTISRTATKLGAVAHPIIPGGIGRKIMV
jgi:hypothetical protein